ncbi:MAG: hypothetical protein DDT19_01739 [Syntrophomonadaceae bacterium]|nr:hypothetical protein [Bacillota bacterium]
MTPEQFAHFLRDNERATGEAIEKHVNGKLDLIRADFIKHTEDYRKFQEEIKPFIQAKAGLGVLFKWLIAIAASLVAFSQIKGYWPK